MTPDELQRLDGIAKALGRIIDNRYEIGRSDLYHALLAIYRSIESLLHGKPTD